MARRLWAAAALAAIAGCAETDEERARRLAAESDRAFALERQADLVVDHQGAEIRIPKPPHMKNDALQVFTPSGFAAHVPRIQSARGLAVVIFGARAGDAERLEELMDGLDGVLRGTGFERVVFEQPGGAGRLILRE